MKEQQNLHEDDLPEGFVPKEFWSDLTDEQFTECLICKTSLDDVIYSVTKVIRQYRGEFKATDTLMEGAICLSCAEEMQGSVSEESTKTMEAFHARLQAVTEQKMKTENEEGFSLLKEEDIPKYLQECALSGQKKEEMDEYHLVSAFSASQMLMPPILISGEVMDELQEQLSEETIDFFERFNGQHFGIPPELQKSPTGPVIFM